MVSATKLLPCVAFLLLLCLPLRAAPASRLEAPAKRTVPAKTAPRVDGRQHRSAPSHPYRFSVTATAYNSVRRQTDRTPHTGAWGDRLDRLPRGVRAIAVSRDLLRRGLKRHERVRIKGFEGEFVVVDCTHRRWRNRIDIYMGKDVRAARRWGKRKVELLWLRARSGRFFPRDTFSGGR